MQRKGVGIGVDCVKGKNRHVINRNKRFKIYISKSDMPQSETPLLCTG